MFDDHIPMHFVMLGLSEFGDPSGLSLVHAVEQVIQQKGWRLRNGARLRR